MVEGKGAKIIYSAPFSPDLKPIENFFSVYKYFLKKHSNQMMDNWEVVHFNAFTPVNRDMGIKYYRRCGIAGATEMKTTDEIQTKIKNDIALFVIITIVMNLIK